MGDKKTVRGTKTVQIPLSDKGQKGSGLNTSPVFPPPSNGGGEGKQDTIREGRGGPPSPLSPPLLSLPGEDVEGNGEEREREREMKGEGSQLYVDRKEESETKIGGHVATRKEEKWHPPGRRVKNRMRKNWIHL